MIQVKLLRNSWPLTSSQLKFMDELKEQELNDRKGNEKKEFVRNRKIFFFAFR